MAHVLLRFASSLRGVCEWSQSIPHGIASAQSGLFIGPLSAHWNCSNELAFESPKGAYFDTFLWMPVFMAQATCL